MIKFLVVFITSSVVIINAASAQKDTSLYYLTNSGKVVSTKDSADYFLFILPPDTSIDKVLFVIKEYYSSGKIRLIGNSKSKTLQTIKFEGSQSVYFPNGRKMRITHFANGEPFGDVLEYYPNGNLYEIKSYTNKGIFFKQFNDSTGTVLVDNGNGHWKEFNENFNKIFAEGDVKNGLEEGQWRTMINDSVGIKRVFKGGKVVFSTAPYRYESERGNYTSVDTVPEFPGGIESLYKFFNKKISYPAKAFENNTQGRVIIAFYVERDGSLSNIRVTRGIGDGCDEEALRVMNSSPPWKPGRQNGKPVRVAFSIPISFTIRGK